MFSMLCVEVGMRCVVPEFSGRIVLPLARVLDDTSSTTSPGELKAAVLDTLCFVLRQLRGDFIVFVPLIRKVYAVTCCCHPYSALS